MAIRMPAALLCLLVAILLVCCGVVASPSGAPPVFRRSCGECAGTDYCEFAYPGTPEGHVACLAYADSKLLHRRYIVPGPLLQARLAVREVANGGSLALDATSSATGFTTLTISNAGNAPLAVSAVAIAGDGWGAAEPSPPVISAGGTADLEIYVTHGGPTSALTTATQTATFTVLATNQAGDAPVTPTAYSFTATGTVTYTPPPRATLTVREVANGGSLNLEAPDSPSRFTTLTISNAGDAPLAVTAVAISGDGWGAAEPQPPVISAGGTADLEIYVTYGGPTTALTTATPSATFTVLATNQAGDGPVTPTAYSFTATGTVTYTPGPS